MPNETHKKEDKKSKLPWNKDKIQSQSSCKNTSYRSIHHLISGQSLAAINIQLQQVQQQTSGVNNNANNNPSQKEITPMWIRKKNQKRRKEDPQQKHQVLVHFPLSDETIDTGSMPSSIGTVLSLSAGDSASNPIEIKIDKQPVVDDKPLDMQQLQERFFHFKGVCPLDPQEMIKPTINIAEQLFKKN